MFLRGDVLVTHPIRILHVVGGMDRGGVETWLMHVLRNIDRQQFQMEFLVHTDRRCAYDDEIESLRSRLHFCPSPSKPFQYRRNFLRILREHGPFDVVHSHVHSFSGYVLRLAKSAGIATRIAHSHSDTSSLDGTSLFHRRLYLNVVRRWIRQYASRKVAVSKEAASNLYGRHWASDSTVSVLHCGIDLGPFAHVPDRAQLRRELGYGPDEFTIGHVGRFETVKNHEFLLRLHANIVRDVPTARLLLIGQGSLETHLRSLAVQLGIADRVTFAGTRADVARILMGAMDVFVMPSLYEGLSLAAVEAQAAGIPTVLSDKFPAEVDIGCGLVHFVSLQKTPPQWAQNILQHASRVRVNRADALAHINRTVFNIEASVNGLQKLYSSTECPA
jgi:glycosyltransferase involved in cell wall biosynthesis